MRRRNRLELPHYGAAAKEAASLLLQVALLVAGCILLLSVISGCSADRVVAEADLPQLVENLVGDDQAAGDCSANISIDGDGNTVQVYICTTPPDQNTGPAGLNFRCSAAPGLSAIRCTWDDGRQYRLVTQNPAYGVASTVCSSPCELDPEQSAPQPRDHEVSLHSATTGVQIAGPVTVRTET